MIRNTLLTATMIFLCSCSSSDFKGAGNTTSEDKKVGSREDLGSTRDASASPAKNHVDATALPGASAARIDAAEVGAAPKAAVDQAEGGIVEVDAASVGQELESREEVAAQSYTADGSARGCYVSPDVSTFFQTKINDTNPWKVTVADAAPAAGASLLGWSAAEGASPLPSLTNLDLKDCAKEWGDEIDGDKQYRYFIVDKSKDGTESQSKVQPFGLDDAKVRANFGLCITAAMKAKQSGLDVSCIPFVRGADGKVQAIQ